MSEEKPIEYWRDLYLLHSRLGSFKRKVDKSLLILDEFISIGAKSYYSFSGGKDSSIIVHLGSKIDSSTRVMSEKDDLDFPNEKEFVQDFCDKCGMKLDIIEPENIIQALSKSDFTEDIHSQGTDFSEQTFYGLIRKYQQENNYKATILGLRSEESKGRRWNRKTKGEIYYNKGWKQLVCQPIVDWSAKDVFAYLFKHDLPILPIYFQTRFVGSPEKMRKSWVLPSGESERGKAQWLKYYYPEIWQKLREINPKMSCYV